MPTVALTEKRCSSCTKTKPIGDFARDRSRPDGLTYWCRPCRNDRARRNHVSRARPGARMGPPPHPPRDGDQVQARQRINVEVRSGRRPRPNALPCTDCGHVWKPGERRHEYDHHHGYGADHHYCVEPVCTTCHAAREQHRGVR